MTSLPLFIAPARFDDPDAAFTQVAAIYQNSVDHLRLALQRFVAGNAVHRQRVLGDIDTDKLFHRFHVRTLPCK